MGVISWRKGDSETLTEDEMQSVLDANIDLIVEGWDEAANNGWDDIVFVWMLEGEDLHHTCIPREAALGAFVDLDVDLPERAREQLSRPAGAKHAWLIFVTDQWMASMKIHCLRHSEMN